MKNENLKSGVFGALEVSIKDIKIKDLRQIADIINCEYLSIIEERRFLIDVEDTTIIYRESGAETKHVMLSGFKRHYLQACKDIVKYGFLLHECGVIKDEP